MASKYACKCGETVRSNLYEGHRLQLLVPEELTDLSDKELQEPCEALIDTLVSRSIVVATCAKCGTIALIDNSYNVKLYVPAT